MNHNIPTKICKECKVEKPATTEYFHKGKTNKYGVRTICRECRSKTDIQDPLWYKKYYLQNKQKLNAQSRVRGRLYYKNNTDSVKQKHKEYFAKNKERMTLRGHRRRAKERDLPSTFTNKQWIECKTHFNNECAYCGEKTEKLTREHFIPVTSGGEFTKDNIIPVCGSCNSSKHNRDFFEWYKQQEYYSEQREKKILKYLNYKNGIQQLSIL